MIGLKILNSFASLNSFEEIGTLEFVPGAQAKLVARLYQIQREDELRYTPDATSSVTLTLVNKDGSELSKSMTVLDSGDRSIWYANLSAIETENLAPGSINFELDDNGTLYKGVSDGGISIIITSGGC